MKKYNKFLIILGCLLLIFTGIYLILPKNISVLTYHDFTNTKSDNDMQMEKDKFEKEIKYLSKHHYKSLTLKDIECYYYKSCKIGNKSVLITMDDGWKNELLIAAPILKKYNFNAVIFYVGSHIDDNNANFMNKEDIENLKQNYPNIEIASHSYGLHYKDSYLKSYSELNQDFKIMNAIVNTKYYAYPYGKYNNRYEKVLKDNGYKLGFTFGPKKEHRKVRKSDSPYEIRRLNMSNHLPMWKFKLRLMLPF